MPTVLAPELQRQYLADLLATRRRIDRLEEERGEVRDLVKKAIEAEWAHESALRALLEGREAEQGALPGLGGPTGRERRLGEILSRAVEAVARITGVRAERGTKADGAAEAPAPALRLAPPRRDVPPLEWQCAAADGVIVSPIASGEYKLEPLAKGGYTALWIPHEGKKKVLLVGGTMDAAHKVCREHYLTSETNHLLVEADSADLVRRDLQGPAEAWKGH